MNFREQIEWERERMRSNAVLHRDDGLLLLFMKTVARIYLAWHEYIFLKLLSIFEPLARGILSRLKSGLDSNRDGGSLVRLSIDLYNSVVFFGLLICYIIAHFIANS